MAQASRGTRTLLAHAVGGAATLLAAILLVPSLAISASWLASDALESAGGIGSISLGLRGGWSGVAAWTVGTLAGLGLLTGVIRRLTRSVPLSILILVIAAVFVGCWAGMLLQYQALPWPGPVAVGVAIGSVFLVLSATYWWGVRITLRLLGKTA